MYYLLNNIQIIEGEIVFEKEHFVGIKNKHFDYSRYIHKFRPTRKSEITKSSDNLFDLLNVGDLIVQQFDEKELGVNGGWLEQIQEIDSEGIHTFNWCVKDCELITKVYKKINKDYLLIFERVDLNNGK